MYSQTRIKMFYIGIIDTTLLKFPTRFLIVNRHLIYFVCHGTLVPYWPQTNVTCFICMCMNLDQGLETGDFFSGQLKLPVHVPAKGISSNFQFFIFFCSFFC